MLPIHTKRITSPADKLMFGVLGDSKLSKMDPVMRGWSPYTFEDGRVSHNTLRASFPSQSAVYSSFIFELIL